ncbi:MAG TPA: glutamate-1-semialdehyde-2,1-aminomutase [Bacteroidetes bacterium]|nr:glutamate-1-semialdehyde-2,1-aminomutase [Bacteroidota bacterium]
MLQNQSNSQRLFERSKALIPGGVNSPVRAFGSVGGEPVFIRKAKGAYLYDADDRAYVDFINSWGPMILGHAFTPVIEAVQNRLEEGFSFGAPTEQEYEMAVQINKMAPWVKQVRLVSSGTEACLSALRLARGFTGRNKFIKFAGCYHGHADPFLVKAGSGVMSFSIPGSAGVPEGATQDTLIAEFNDTEGVEKLFKKHGNTLAAVIIEPVAGNMGCILPEKGFLENLRRLCTEYGTVLIFDEVMTGFRLARGGAAEVYKVIPDLLTYGKVIGGGMPVGAFGGRKDIMQHLAPIGNVYQAGTLSGNPVAVSCGLATLRYLDDHSEIYPQLDQSGTRLAKILDAKFKNAEVPFCINRLGSMISIHFGTTKLQNYTQALAARNEVFNRLFHHLLNRGIYLPPSAFETWFISTAIHEEQLKKVEVALADF